jgi:hypothetical protein
MDKFTFTYPLSFFLLILLVFSNLLVALCQVNMIANIAIYAQACAGLRYDGCDEEGVMLRPVQRI